MAIKKSKRRSVKVSTPSFHDLLSPSYLIFCEYVLFGQDKSVSLLRLIEKANVLELPVVPPKFNLVAEFSRIENRTSIFNSAKPKLKVDLINPAAEVIDFGEYEVSKLPGENLWDTHRLVLDLSMSIKFMHCGTYNFEISGKTKNSDYEKLMSRSLKIQKIES